jgi:hypothetical protein
MHTAIGKGVFAAQIAAYMKAWLIEHGTLLEGEHVLTSNLKTPRCGTRTRSSTKGGCAAGADDSKRPLPQR